MALTQTLKIDLVTTPFVLGTTDSIMTSTATQGNITGQIPTVLDYYSWATTIVGINPTDIGGGSQNPTSMCSFIARTVDPLSGEPFNFYANGSLQAANAYMQQPIVWEAGVHTPDDVVWGVYAPRPDGAPIGGVGKIEAFGTVINAPASAAANDPDDATAKSALTDLLAQLGTKYASFGGPVFTGNATTDLFGTTGAIAMGMMISYSNTNGTWLVYAG